MLKQTVIHTPAGAAPAEKPAGAMNSVFDTPVASPMKRNKLGERSRQRVLDGLQEGEASGGALAKRVGLTQPTVSAILRELVAEGLVESNGEAATSRNLRYRIKLKTAADGFRAWLAKTGATSAEGRAAPGKKELFMKANEPTVVTGHRATRTRRAEVRTDTMPAPAPTWSCALESSGHLVIRANGQELALDAGQARGVTAWLQRVDAALSAALGA